ncbi:unnamed protein product [Cyprideis torosa]|uniref:DNA ligase n=1 Tax=Cyprideis torosa TaxID=163714 RepID=A0A7R8ZNY2_9CRUS|nr:unnamed protein product [Cyprideis torosa]CAG0897472.1 unnamed protein product [Cyprideis torosa]
MSKKQGTLTSYFQVIPKKQAASERRSPDSSSPEEKGDNQSPSPKGRKIASPRALKASPPPDEDSPLQLAKGRRKRVAVIESESSESEEGEAERRCPTPKKSAKKLKLGEPEEEEGSTPSRKKDGAPSKAKKVANGNAKGGKKNLSKFRHESSEEEEREKPSPKTSPENKTSPKSKGSPETKKEDFPETKKKSSKTSKSQTPSSSKSITKVPAVKDKSKKKKSSPKPSAEKIKASSPRRSPSPPKEETEDDGDTAKEDPSPKQPSRKPPKSMSAFFTRATEGKEETEDLGASYDPSKLPFAYHPVRDAFWNKGEQVPYLALARTLMLVVLNLEILKHVADATGRTLDKLRAEIKSEGDIGIVAEGARCTQRLMIQPPQLTVDAVFQKLNQIADMSGSASQAKKVGLIKSTIVACRFCEARFFVRSLRGKLRIGLAEQSMLQALAEACVMTPPELQGSLDDESSTEALQATKGIGPEAVKAKVDALAFDLKTAHSQCPSYDILIPVLLKHGVKALAQHCPLAPGVPLKPMLAHPTKGVADVVTKFEGARFTCEWKYDGERAQVHLCDKEEIRIFSRNQENHTSKYPEIVRRLRDAFVPGKVQTCIIDSEAVAFDVVNKKILPFQVLSTRKRKDANEAEIKVQVCLFAFDLLYLNGEALVQRPFRERRNLLKDCFKEVEGDGVWNFAGNCEGLMVKTLDDENSNYEIARRSHKWLKVKKDYLEGVGDTLDVVPIGGYHGKGKRAGNFGGFLLAIYDPDNEEYQTVCKIGTGFSDEDLDNHTKFFKDNVSPRPKSYYRFDGSHAPDVWFEPVQVWEIKCADISLSPAHKAAIGLVSFSSLNS